MQYKITSYIEGCEKHILELFQEAFKRDFSYDNWYWRFKANPFGEPSIKCMWDGDALIGHSALNLQYAWVRGKYTKIAYNGTSMGKQGYVGTIPLLIKELTKNDPEIDCYYTAPNSNSYLAFEKILKWKNIANIKFMYSAPSIQKVNHLNIQKLFAFTKDHTRLVEELKNSHIFINARDENYLTWRYLLKPNSDYEIFEYRLDNQLKAWMVLNIYDSTNEKHGQIIDIVAPSLESFEKLIIFALNYFYGKADIVKTWITSSVYLDKVIKLGFKPLSSPQFPLFIKSETSFGSIEDMYITMADSDVF